MTEIPSHQIPQGEYDYFFSLGEACPTAMLLKTVGLRSCSGPFDWVSGLTLEKRLDIFLGKIPLFSDEDEWEYVGNRYEPEPRDIYINKRLNLTYPHDFLYQTPLKISLPIVQERYTRRLQRALSILNQNKKVLFVFMSAKKSDDFDLEQIAQNYVRFNKKITAESHLIYIQNNEKVAAGEFLLSHPNEFLTFIECFYSKQDGKIDVELLKKIFSGYHCTGERANKRWLKRQRLKKKIKSWFINKRIKGDDFYYRILGFKYRPKPPKSK